MKIYIASKVKYAQYWPGLREKLKSIGHVLTSTWIDEAAQGESNDLRDLSHRCIREATSSDIMILYCDKGDYLKGALLEVGAALGSGKRVYQVGHCDSISTVFQNHENWVNFETISDVLRHLVDSDNYLPSETANQ